MLVGFGIRMGMARNEAEGPFFTARTGQANIETALSPVMGQPQTPNQGLSQKTYLGANQDLPQTFPKETTSSLPSLHAHIALVADLKTGDTYYDLNSNDRWPIASITKLATAAFTKDHMPEMDFKISKTQVPRNNKDLPFPGEKYAKQDLFKILLTFSSNEAAVTLAESYEGDFIGGMNEMVKSWGMFDTHFADSSGLSSVNQSTARDLLKLAQKIYAEYPELLAITRTPKSSAFEEVSSSTKQFQNINVFAGDREFIGGKTGFTDEAKQNLLSIFDYQGRPIVIIVLGTDDRFGETSKLFNWFKNNHSR